MDVEGAGVGEQDNSIRMDRRDLLKKSVVAGGIVWAAPTVFASPASAAGVGACPDCPPGRLFGLKNDSANSENPTTIGGGATCVTNPGGLGDGTCLVDNGITIDASAGTVTFVLSPGIQYCQAAAKGGNNEPDPCAASNTVVQANTPSAGFTTVTVTHPTLSHSEIIVCVNGTLPQGC